jgi:hypothetical protein
MHISEKAAPENQVVQSDWNLVAIVGDKTVEFMEERIWSNILNIYLLFIHLAFLLLTYILELDVVSEALAYLQTGLAVKTLGL